MKIFLIGYGNVGKELENVLTENSIPADFIVRSNGIFKPDGFRVGEKENIFKYVDKDSVLFISVPSKNEGIDIADYYIKSLEKGARIVTCEKAFIAYHWEIIKKYKNNIKYSATVGGGSGILDAITDYDKNINEIKAVINGTLNYIGDRLGKDFSKEDVYREVVTKGYAEPGARNFDEVIKNELRDVAYKAAILINHSAFSREIVTPKDIVIKRYQDGLRCAVILNKEGIHAGFMKFDDTAWFPEGVNNVLYINNNKIVEGPGAGGRITAEKMFRDFLTQTEHFL